MEMRLKDATLEKLDQTGVTLKTNFDVKPGGYLVRLVVRDIEGRAAIGAQWRGGDSVSRGGATSVGGQVIFAIQNACQAS